MSKTTLNALFAAATFSIIAVATSACGGTERTAASVGAANVEACEDLVASLRCGNVDVRGQIPCNQYASTTCDISEYFDCLATKYVCRNGTWDTAKLATASQCADKAVCR
jgi:hypothetical protein